MIQKKRTELRLPYERFNSFHHDVLWTHFLFSFLVETWLALHLQNF